MSTRRTFYIVSRDQAGAFPPHPTLRGFGHPKSMAAPQVQGSLCAMHAGGLAHGYHRFSLGTGSHCVAEAGLHLSFLSNSNYSVCHGARSLKASCETGEKRSTLPNRDLISVPPATLSGRGASSPSTHRRPTHHSG